MICYVVTSLNNRASKELVLRDIERLRAAGAFDANAADRTKNTLKADAEHKEEQEQQSSKACVLVAAQSMVAAKELVAQLGDSIPTYIFDAHLNLSFLEHVMLALSKRYAFAACIFSKKLKPVLKRKAQSLLSNASKNLGATYFEGDAPSFERIIFLEAHDEYLVHVFMASCLPISIMLHDGMPNEMGAIYKAQHLFDLKVPCIDGVTAKDAHLSYEARMTVLDNELSAIMRLCRAKFDNEAFHFSGVIAIKRTDLLGELSSLQLKTDEGVLLCEIGQELQSAQFNLSKSNLSKSAVKIPFSFTIDREKASSLPLITKLFLCYKTHDMGGRSGIRYCSRDFGKHGAGRVGKVLVDKKNNSTCFLCQSDANFCQLVFRATDISDVPAVRRRIRLAWLLSQFQPVCKKIVLWEKFSSHYEESARRVYERLVDDGKSQACFILDEDVLKRELSANKIKPAYQNQIVHRCSFEHYRIFFSARTFISTETFAHLSGLHPSSRLVRRHIKKARFNYVFLQHGVMYMIPLGNAKRGALFSSADSNGLWRVVVSSEVEKQHFVQLGGYKPEELYVCGLPKYDANKWDSHADLIAIMPTWRPWEIGDVRINLTESKYYKMLLKIFNAVPEQLKDKVRILVHPRFQDFVFASNSPLRPYMVDDTPYDEVLQHVKLLITDYSSISYDAFYRGANVIFEWEELDECMQSYGQGTHLMLTQDLAFGDIYFGEHHTTNNGEHSTQNLVSQSNDEHPTVQSSSSDSSTLGLSALIEKGYFEQQNTEYIRRYRQIVNFHDGKNTDRLMEMMRKDGII